MAGYRRPGRRALWSKVSLFASTGAIFALVLLGVIVFALRGRSTADPVAASTPAATQTSLATQAPTPEPSLEPTAQVTEEAVQAAVPQHTYRVEMPAPIEEGYLPIFSKAKTSEKIIAITVDDFFQFSNARTIIDTAVESGAKLTLFPIGKNVLRKELHDTLIYAHECGMEIENHTFEHRPLYKMDDAAMARQVYLQSLAVDYVLGMDYQEHFLRPGGGDGRDDQRTHLYIQQLGMYGIAHWTISGSETGLDALIQSLEPGNIYLFHTTDSDTKKLQDFIPTAIEAGYTLVTLNEMFNLPDNEVRPLDGPINIHDIPQIRPYALNPRTYGKGDYQWMAFRIQQRLIELGYLTGEADGIYGDSTAEAIGDFQQANGLPTTGEADHKTQDLLFDPNAQKKN